MTPARALALALLTVASGCSEQDPSPNAAAPAAQAPAPAVPRMATWAGQPAGRLAVTSGRLAVEEGCVVLQGEGGSRAVAFSREAVSWGARGRAVVLGGAAFPLGRQIGLAGGSIDTARAAADPLFRPEGCVRGPLLFVVERMYPEPPPQARPFIAVNALRRALLPLAPTMGEVAVAGGCVVFRYGGRESTPLWPSGTALERRGAGWAVRLADGRAIPLPSRATLTGAQTALNSAGMTKHAGGLPEGCPRGVYAVGRG